MKALLAPKFFSNTRITILVSVLVSLAYTDVSPAVAAKIPRPPGTLQMFELLIGQTNAVTGFPFSLFPGLNGSDKTKFINDKLINRDELIHLTAFLEGQLQIAIQFIPDLVKPYQKQMTNCKYLGKYFAQIATAVDAKGSQAISAEDLERLFIPALLDQESDSDTRQKRKSADNQPHKP